MASEKIIIKFYKICKIYNDICINSRNNEGSKKNDKKEICTKSFYSLTSLVEI